MNIDPAAGGCVPEVEVGEVGVCETWQVGLTGLNEIGGRVTLVRGGLAEARERTAAIRASAARRAVALSWAAGAIPRAVTGMCFGKGLAGEIRARSTWTAGSPRNSRVQGSVAGAMLRSLPLAALLIVWPGAALADDPKIDFWDQPARGANLFNRVETRERLAAAARAGIRVVRIAPDKWRTRHRDFLVGDADRWSGLAEDDLATLLRVLDDAHAEHLKVVLTMLSVPGCRWRQNNGDRDDPRLWTEPGWVSKVAAFWSALAERLRDHPALVGFDPLNEPHPPAGRKHEVGRFYREVVAAIRAVDPRAPIVVEPPDHGSASGFEHFEPVADRRVVTSFHFYEPWEYVNRQQNRGCRPYPGRETVLSRLAPADRWVGCRPAVCSWPSSAAIGSRQERCDGWPT